MIPRYYLRLHARTSEDMSLTCKTSYQMMTAATGLYRRIRASPEPAHRPIGLDQSRRTRRLRLVLFDWIANLPSRAEVSWSLGGLVSLLDCVERLCRGRLVSDHDAGEFDAGPHAELGEGVAEVGVDGVHR